MRHSPEAISRYQNQLLLKRLAFGLSNEDKQFSTSLYTKGIDCLGVQELVLEQMSRLPDPNKVALAARSAIVLLILGARCLYSEVISS